MTVTEIARIAGVSIGTVDRVLHNRGRVATETREKVQTVIDQVGFQPDLFASQLKKRSHYKIGVLIPEFESGYGYWKVLYDGIQSTAKSDYSSFSFEIKTFEFSRNDNNSLRGQFEKMHDDNCSACIIAPVLTGEIKFLLDEFCSDMPYCFVDSPFPDCCPVSTITQPPYKAGFCAGRVTKIVTGREGVYAVFMPFSQTFNQKERARGFCDWFKQNEKNSSVISIASSNFSKEEIYNELDKLFSTTPNLVAICTVSAEVQLVADYIQNSGGKKISLSGFELVEGNRKYLQEGKIDCLIDQRPFEQGQLALRQLFKKLVYDENPEKEISIPLDIFFKENV